LLGSGQAWGDAILDAIFKNDLLGELKKLALMWGAERELRSAGRRQKQGFNACRLQPEIDPCSHAT
jgi:hypothetical protein